MTEKGLTFVEAKGIEGTSRDSQNQGVRAPSASAPGPGASGQNDGKPALSNRKPVWDGEYRELRVDGLIVKRFRWRAPNQETLLAVFEEED